MCTIGYHQEIGVVFKNRDKQSVATEEIISTEHFMACRTMGANYYSWGMNIHGCVFVTAAINTPVWTRLVYDGNLIAAAQRFEQDNKGLENPVVQISAMLPEVTRIDDWIQPLTTQTAPSMGYNLLLADRQRAVVIESYKEERCIRELRPQEAVTNHFHMIQHGPKSREEYPSSFRRYEYANRSLAKAETLKDIMTLLKPADANQQRLIWRQYPFLTVSSSIINFKADNVYYANRLGEEYQIARLYR